MVRLRYQDIEESFGYIKSVGFGKASAIIIFTSYEVDALSSTRMLTHLLKTENIYYSVHMVTDQSSMLTIYEKYRQANDERIVIMMNCGATMNIPKLFGLQRGGSNVRCFIMDNHRPFHLANIYSAYAVVVFDDSALSMSNTIPEDGSDLSDIDESDDDAEDILSDAVEEEEEEVSEAEEADEEAEFVEGEGADDINDEANEGIDQEEAASADDEEVQDQDSDDGKGDEEDAAEVQPERVAEGGQVEEEDMGRSTNEEVSHESDSATERGDDEENSDRDPVDGGETLPHAQRDDVGMDGESQGEAVGKRDREGQDEEEDEVVRRKRAPDPRKLRRDRLRSYYRSSETVSGCPTSFCLLDVVKAQLNNNAVNVDLVWQTALGVTDAYLRDLIGEEEYSGFVSFLRSDIADLDVKQRSFTQEDHETGVSIVIPTAEAGQIRYVSDEYRFFMYRHWSLFDGMLYSPYIGRKLHTWRQQGKNKLQEFLARIGVPLEQCEQHFTHMKPQLK